MREIGRGACWISLGLPGIAEPLDVGARPGEHVLSVIAYLRGTKPRGNQGAYMRRLLELSRDADVARIGLDGDGDVSLIYEVPEVHPGLLDRVGTQFSLLIAGLVELERGN